MTAVAPPVIKGFEHIRRYWHPRHNGYVARVLPGQYYISRGGEWICTVLGSCVSACIRDPLLRVGGLNHFMLPQCSRTGKWDDGNILEQAHRYGSYAMEHMINDILELGGCRSRLEVKIVGGGQVLRHPTDIGSRNIAFVREYLHNEGFSVVSDDLGDVYPREVYYEVTTGRMRVRKLPKQASAAVKTEESSYQRAIESRLVAGSIELVQEGG